MGTEVMRRYTLPLVPELIRRLERINEHDKSTDMLMMSTQDFFKRMKGRLRPETRGFLEGSLGNEHIDLKSRMFPHTVFSTLGHHTSGLHVDDEHPSIFITGFGTGGQFIAGAFPVGSNIMHGLEESAEMMQLQSMRIFAEKYLSSGGRFLILGADTRFEQAYAEAIRTRLVRTNVPVDVLLFHTQSPVSVSHTDPFIAHQFAVRDGSTDTTVQDSENVVLKPNRRFHTVFHENKGTFNKLFILGDLPDSAHGEAHEWLSSLFNMR